MILPEDWKKLPVPLGFTASVLGVLWGAWAVLHLEFAQAQEFQQFKQTVETRALQRDQKQIETKVLELQLKREFTPKQFTPIDKRLLEKHEQDLKEIKEELKQLRSMK